MFVGKFLTGHLLTFYYVLFKLKLSLSLPLAVTRLLIKQECVFLLTMNMNYERNLAKSG
jgi:hypothetical protein